MKKLTYKEFTYAMWKFNNDNQITSKGNDKYIEGIIVFTEDSFDKPFTETERSYKVSSDNKAWIAGMTSNSIFGDCLDGKDLGVRLDWYMYDGWKVDYCYLLDEKETERELKLKELKKLEEEHFVLWMKDRWDSDDYWLDTELKRKIDALEKELN